MTAFNIPFPSMGSPDRMELKIIKTRNTPMAINTPIGCRFTKAAALAASFSVVTAVFFAALAPCLAVSLACLAYWRFSFHFWENRERGLLASSGCSCAIC